MAVLLGVIHLLRILSLETSFRQGSVAALIGTGAGVNLLHELLLPADERSARILLPTVKDLLSRCGWQSSDIDMVCVTTGPGSFTGLRIGVTAAKTLAFALGAKLVGVHTLAALAASVPQRGASLWTILDAQRQELFAAKFTGEDIPRSPDTKIIAIEDWLAELQTGDTVIGPPLAQLAKRLPQQVNLADAKLWQPQASAVGQLGYELFQAGAMVDPIQLVPSYYRKSAAEEKASSTDP